MDSDTPTAPHDYAALNLSWAALMSGLLAATARQATAAPAASELPVLGLAAFSLTKAISREKVGVWMREPLVETDPSGERHPRGSGLRYALGELVTCSRCLGAWGSLGLVALRMARPREGRIVSSVLAVSAVNDLVHAAFTRTTAEANTGEARARLTDLQARREEHSS